MRDMRDPEKLWKAISKRKKRNLTPSWGLLVRIDSPDYRDGPHMSSNPRDHHSKTPQTLGDLSL